MEPTEKKRKEVVTVSTGNIFASVLFLLMFLYTDWLLIPFWYYTCYVFTLLNIFFLFRSFPAAAANKNAKNRGLFLISVSFILSNITCFAVIYEKNGLLFRKQTIYSRYESLYYSICNFIGRSCEYTHARSCNIQAAFQTLLGLVAFAYLIGAFVEIVRARKESSIPV